MFHLGERATLRVLRLVMLPPANGCQIAVAFQFSSVEILLENRHLTQELPVLQSLLFQGASLSFDVVGPLHKETDPAAQDLQLPPGWIPILLVLLSGVPHIARSSSSDRPSTGSVASHDPVRCRGPTGAGHLAAGHTIRETFVLAVVRSQIKVFGRGRSGSPQARSGANVVVRHGGSPQIHTSGGLGFNVHCLNGMK